MENRIQMVDLKGQYLKIKDEVNTAIQDVLDKTSFINGPAVDRFAQNLSEFMGSGVYSIPCANGTDALQIALMALDLKPGDEIIVPAFTYVATAEVIGLLGLTPVMVDVDFDTFNIKIENITNALTERTKAIVPVHLFGQSCDMEPILKLAAEHKLYVVEDNAQAIGATYTFNDGRIAKTGAMGTIGCTSFFPSKNLGCYGDGGALFTTDERLAKKIKMIANHGQEIKYHHKVIGCNSRLDTIQAAILDIKLKHLQEYSDARYKAAQYYSKRIKELDPNQELLIVPKEAEFSTHVYHQYTLKVKKGLRNALKDYLISCGVPCMIYYPLPLQEQEAFKSITRSSGELIVSSDLANSVLSLPMHTELSIKDQDTVIDVLQSFIKNTFF